MDEKKCSSWDWAALILRLMIGAIFVSHGYQKWFEWGIDSVVENFGKMGVPFPSVSAYACATTEFLGGILLLVGFNARMAAALLSVVMAGAIITVHPPAFDKPFFNLIAEGGMELPLSLLAGCMAIALNGGGRCSVDGKLRGPEEEAR